MRKNILIPVVFLFIFPFFCFAKTSIVINGSYFKKVHSSDKGTVHIFLYNNSSSPITITNIFYNGEELTDMPNDYTIWYQVTPPVISPEEFADLKIKLRFPTKKLIRVGFVDSKGEKYETVIEPKPSPLSFTGAYFDNQLKNLYLYIQNNSSGKYTIKKIYLNGKGINTYIPERIIYPEKKIPVIIELKEKIKHGKYVMVKVETEQVENCYCLQRTYSYFPIQGYGRDGDNREEFFFNKDRFDFHYHKKKLQTFKELPVYKACHIYDDPACVDGNKCQRLGTSAKEIIEKTNTFYQYDKIHPTFLYGCEHRKPDNYFIYAETVDVFVVDPYEIIYYHNEPEKNAYFTKLAKLACQPRILWTIPEAFTHRGTRFQTQEEERIIVYSEIGEGSKGIWYFVYNQKTGYPANKLLEEEIKKINWELQQLKDSLLISEPFKLAKVEIDKVTPYTLLCGDKGIVLILINNDHKSYFDQGKPPFTYNQKQNFKVEVSIPNWLRVKEIKEVKYPEERNIEFREERKSVIISIDTLDITRQFLILTERK